MAAVCETKGLAGPYNLPRNYSARLAKNSDHRNYTGPMPCTRCDPRPLDVLPSRPDDTDTQLHARKSFAPNTISPFVAIMISPLLARSSLQAARVAVPRQALIQQIRNVHFENKVHHVSYCPTQQLPQCACPHLLAKCN